MRDEDEDYDDEPNESGSSLLSILILVVLAIALTAFLTQRFSAGSTHNGGNGSSSTYKPPKVARACEKTNKALITAKRFANCKNAKGYAWEKLKHNTKQFKCLDLMWINESGWDDEIQGKEVIVNGKPERAQGIPQALGHGHVFDLGDWKAQVDWGLKYIKGRYDTPCDAWTFWQRTDPRPHPGNWY